MLSSRPPIRDPGSRPMKAHIVGGGFGGLAAAGYLIRNAGVPGQDITIYEADQRMGGGFFLTGSAESGMALPIFTSTRSPDTTVSPTARRCGARI